MSSNLSKRISIKYTPPKEIASLHERIHKISAQDANGNTRKAETYIIPRDPMLETVLHCVNVFVVKGLDLGYNHTALFNNFSSIVEEDNYNNYVVARNAGPQNNRPAFDRCMERFVRNYCRADTKQYQYKHFTTCPEDYKKGPKTGMRQHANRLTTIVRHVNALPPAAEYNITEDEKKECLLKSCPFVEQPFAISGQRLENMTYADLVDWMDEIKIHADAEWEKSQAKRKSQSNGNNDTNYNSKRSRSNHDNRGGRGGRHSGRGYNNRSGGRGGRGNSNSNPQHSTYDPNLNPCRKHNGAHLWGECPDNWNAWHRTNHNKQLWHPQQ